MLCAPCARAVLCSLLVSALGCSSDKKPATSEFSFSGTCPTIRGLPSEPDQHCVDTDGSAISVPTLPLACAMPGGAPTSTAGTGLDPSSFDDAASVEVDDAECKYHVSLRAACPSSAPEIGFMITVTKRTDDSAATAAAPWMDAILGTTHPAPNFNRDFDDLGAGSYTVGPVQFDRVGTWSLELHLFESCANGPGSPHAHANYEIDIQ